MRKSGVKSAQRAIDVLEVLSENPDGLRHGEIAALLGIPKGSLSALLETLVSRHYVGVERDTQRFTIGPRVLMLAGRYLGSLDLVQLAQPHLRALTREIDETSFLAVAEGDDIIVLWKESCTQPLVHTMNLGDRGSLALTGAGQAILAFRLPPLDWESNRSRWRSQLRGQFDQIDQQILAVRSGAPGHSSAKWVADVVAIGLPLFDFSNTVVGAISVTVPLSRFSAKSEAAIVAAMRRCAIALSRELGCATYPVPVPATLPGAPSEAKTGAVPTAVPG